MKRRKQNITTNMAKIYGIMVWHKIFKPNNMKYTFDVAGVFIDNHHPAFLSHPHKNGFCYMDNLLSCLWDSIAIHETMVNDKREIDDKRRRLQDYRRLALLCSKSINTDDSHIFCMLCYEDFGDAQCKIQKLSLLQLLTYHTKKHHPEF